VTGRDRLLAALAPELVDAIKQLVDECVRERLDAEQAQQLKERTWLTLQEAGDRLGCSPNAVRMRARRGRLEHRYQGRRLYVAAAAVDRLS
jgi:DNA-directed RNA polymerase specialized sigma24 family protein